MNKSKSIIGFKITSFNQEEKSCNLTVTSKPPGADKAKVKNYKGVKVSSLLNWNLNSEKSINVNTKHYYESTIDSSVFKENPFQLIKYTDRNGDEQLLLTLVTEDKVGKPIEVDPMGGKALNFQFHKKENFKRYRNRTTKIKA